MMNTGKIMIGFALILLSVAMMVSPSGATWPLDFCEVGSGNHLSGADMQDQPGMHHSRVAGFSNNDSRCNATYPYER